MTEGVPPLGRTIGGDVGKRAGRGPLAGLMLLAGLCLATLGACASPGREAGGDQLHAAPVQLSEDGRDKVGRLVWRGGLALTSPSSAFGGLSDLRLGPDGRQFAAVTDAGASVTGWLVHDPTGRLTGVRDVTIRPLLGEDGTALVGKDGDAEGLVRLPRGGWLVAFERDHRILHYPGELGAGRPQRLALPEEVMALPTNEGLEALTDLPDGRLLLIAEFVAAEDGTSPAWIGLPGDWAPFRYRARAPFRPVAAAALPDGDVIVLERRLTLVGGWGSRIVRVAARDLARASAQGEVVEGEELGRIDPPMLTENYEGIAARRQDDGGVVLYLVSDDNFRTTQRTLLVKFQLKE